VVCPESMPSGGITTHKPISMIPNGVSVLRSRAPVHPMHDEEVGSIEEKKSGSLLICLYTSGRSLRSTFLSLLFVPRLDGMRVDDCPN
jgi:hypothetical protein